MCVYTFVELIQWHRSIDRHINLEQTFSIVHATLSEFKTFINGSVSTHFTAKNRSTFVFLTDCGE